MGKLRNAKTDVGAMAQYLARKCVIHSPQAELDLDAKAKKTAPRFGKSDIHEGSKVHMLKKRGAAKDEEPNEFVAMSPTGRAIKVTVEEIDPTEISEDLFAKVGS